MNLPQKNRSKKTKISTILLFFLFLLFPLLLQYCTPEEPPNTTTNQGGNSSGNQIDVNFDYGSAYDLTNIDVVVDDNFADGKPQFFKFYFDKVCILDIDVYNTPVEFRIKVYETSDDNSVIFTSEYIDPGEDVTWTVGPMPIGDHYIELQPRSSSNTSGTFGIKVAVDCSDQTEFNNTFNTATEIPTDGTPYFGRILAANDNSANEDFDMLKFNITNMPSIVKVQFTAPDDLVSYYSNAKIDVSIYNNANDDSSSKLEYVRVTEGETGYLLVGPLDIGEHYISVNYGGYCNCQSKSPYKITLTLDQRDIYEFNDNQAWGAKDISDKISNGLPIEGMLVYPNGDKAQDSDWFVFQVQNSGSYNFDLFSLNIPQYSYLYFYTELTSSSDYTKRVYTTNGDIASFQVELEAGKQYWILVEGYSSSTESDEMYSVNITPL